jgi:hypothetical protein
MSLKLCKIAPFVVIFLFYRITASMSVYPKYKYKFMNKKILRGKSGIKTDTYIEKRYFDSSELIREINTLIECRKKFIKPISFR